MIVKMSQFFFPNGQQRIRISTEITAGKEFDYKIIKCNFNQTYVIILFDIDFLNEN